jgi:hypothetical protein
LPIFRFNQAFRGARDAKAPPDAEQQAGDTENPRKNTRRRVSKRRQQIKSRKQELRRLRRLRQGLPSASEGAERKKYKKSKKRIQQEIFQLKEVIRASRQRANNGPQGRPPPRAADVSETGTLPDFAIIGGKKCGTTSLYNLLTQHPHVEPAASKELHYFDLLFDEGTEWYRRCFPAPRWEDGRWTITGEATPYIASRVAPKRMAEVAPRTRLIALLRNPVDRAYSDYQQVVRKGREPQTFEEAVGSESSEYLSRSVYVDQLLRWSEFFPEEQTLVLKSEDFFERPQETLKVVHGFLDLPYWELEAPEIRNKGTYKQQMALTTRQRLEEYFEPYNRRLYEYLGVDFGW